MAGQEKQAVDQKQEAGDLRAEALGAATRQPGGPPETEVPTNRPLSGQATAPATGRPVNGAGEVFYSPDVDTAPARDDTGSDRAPDTPAEAPFATRDANQRDSEAEAALKQEPGQETDGPAVNDAGRDAEVEALLEDYQVYEMSVEAEALENEIMQLETFVIPSLEKQAAGFERQASDVERLFDQAFQEPRVAQARYDQMAVLEGVDKATAMMEQNPTAFGDLKGSVMKPRQRGAAAQAVTGIAHQGAGYHRGLQGAASAERHASRNANEGGEESKGRGFQRGENGGRGAQRKEVGWERWNESGTTDREPSGRTNGVGRTGTLEDRAEQTAGARGAAEEMGREPTQPVTVKHARFEMEMDRLFERPGEAIANFQKVEARLGTDRAAFGLHVNPEGLGVLNPGVARSAAVRKQYARSAALSAVDLAKERTAQRGGRRVNDAASSPQLEAAKNRLTALRTQVASLQQKIEERTRQTGRLQGMKAVEQKKALQQRINKLSEQQVGKLNKALQKSTGWAAASTAGRGLSHGKSAATTAAAAKGGPAAMIAAQLAERTVRRVSEEMTGRQMIER